MKILALVFSLSIFATLHANPMSAFPELAGQSFPQFDESDPDRLVTELRKVVRTYGASPSQAYDLEEALLERIIELKLLWRSRVGVVDENATPAIQEMWADLIFNSILKIKPNQGEGLIGRVLATLLPLDPESRQRLNQHSFLLFFAKPFWPADYYLATSEAFATFLLNSIRNHRGLGIRLSVGEVGKVLRLLAACHRAK